MILLIMIWLTKETYIYAGLGLYGKNGTADYKFAFNLFLAGLIIFTFFISIDLIIQFTGVTFNFYKLNVINLSLKIFELYLLALFYLDSWHHVTIYYICAVTQLPCAIFEIYAIIHSICTTFKKYNKILANEVNYINQSGNNNIKNS